MIKAKTQICSHACYNPSSHWSCSAAPAITKPAGVSLCRFPEWGLHQHLSLSFTHFSPLLVWNLHQSSRGWILDSEGRYSAFILSSLLCQEPVGAQVGRNVLCPKWQPSMGREALGLQQQTHWFSSPKKRKGTTCPSRSQGVGTCCRVLEGAQAVGISYPLFLSLFL